MNQQQLFSFLISGRFPASVSAEQSLAISCDDFVVAVNKAMPREGFQLRKEHVWLLELGIQYTFERQVAPKQYRVIYRLLFHPSGDDISSVLLLRAKFYWKFWASDRTDLQFQNLEQSDALGKALELADQAMRTEVELDGPAHQYYAVILPKIQRCLPSVLGVLGQVTTRSATKALYEEAMIAVIAIDAEEERCVTPIVFPDEIVPMAEAPVLRGMLENAMREQGDCSGLIKFLITHFESGLVSLKETYVACCARMQIFLVEDRGYAEDDRLVKIMCLAAEQDLDGLRAMHPVSAAAWKTSVPLLNGGDSGGAAKRSKSHIDRLSELWHTYAKEDAAVKAQFTDILAEITECEEIERFLKAHTPQSEADPRYALGELVMKKLVGMPPAASMV